MQQGSINSEFDDLLLTGFQRMLGKGLMRSDPTQLQRRTLEGSMGITLQYSSEHFGKKRRPKDIGEQVVAPANPEGFNFTKASSEELIAEIPALPEGHAAGRGPTKILGNISPLAIGHVLLVPCCDEVRPQVLSQELLCCGLHLLQKSARKDFRLMFNSLLGFASVNHFHFHGLYLEHCGLPEAMLPIERVSRVAISGSIAEGHTQLELLMEKQWYIRGFVVRAGPRSNCGEDNRTDLEALAGLAAQVVAQLQKRNIPHNVLLTKARDRKAAPEAQLVGINQGELPPLWGGEEVVSGPVAREAQAPEVYILPRLPEPRLREDAGFNAAICEMAGFITTMSEDTFNDLTEDRVSEIFRKDVCIDEGLFNQLICRTAWFAS